MNKLNTSASSIADRYIVKASDSSAESSKPKRGLQAEINKLDAINRVIGTNNIDANELIRMKTHVNKLLNSIDFKLTKK